MASASALRHRAAEARRDRRAGRGRRHGGGAQREAADGGRSAVWQGRPRRGARRACSIDEMTRDVRPAMLRADGGGRAGAADRLRQRGEPAARARRRPGARARGSGGARRRARPSGAAAADRERGARVSPAVRSGVFFAWGLMRAAAGVGARGVSPPRRRPARLARARLRACCLARRPGRSRGLASGAGGRPGPS